MQGASSRTLARSRAAYTLLFCLGVVSFSPATVAQPHFRSLAGKVTDGREPLKGAVVLLRQESTDSIQSYITDGDGHYHFKRLDPEGDYSVWATFRGQRARSRAISRFDTHLDKTIDLVIRGR